MQEEFQGLQETARAVSANTAEEFREKTLCPFYQFLDTLLQNPQNRLPPWMGKNKEGLIIILPGSRVAPAIGLNKDGRMSFTEWLISIPPPQGAERKIEEEWYPVIVRQSLESFQKYLNKPIETPKSSPKLPLDNF